MDKDGSGASSALPDLPADFMSNVSGDSNYVRVQGFTPVGVLDGDKQVGVVRELTDIVAAARKALAGK